MNFSKQIFKINSIIFSTLICLIFFSGCKPKQNVDPVYLSEIQQWHQKRINRLKKPNGWLSLVGLYWLKEGKNTFGTADDNDIVFPKGDKHIGTFFLADSEVTIKISPDSKVLDDDNPVKEMNLKNDLQDSTTILQLGSLRWFVIKRGEKFGVRLRDTDSPLIKNFKGIEIYPINESWKVNAKFVPYNPPRKISIPTILGTVEDDYSPGALVFKKDGKEYKLDAIDEGDSFFIIFADETNGEETYGAGRFLYTEKPDSNGNVILDFNKAYNPPCNFTKFATCPLPPKQNYLHLAVTAGEKKYDEED